MQLETVPGQIEPQPIPTTVKVGVGTDATGRAWVMLALASPIGENTYFLAPEIAEWLQDQLGKNSSQARSGIITPALILPPDVIPPPPPASPNGHPEH